MICAILRITDTLARHVHPQDKVHVGTNPLCYIATLTTGKVNQCLVTSTQSSVKQDPLLNPPVVEMTEPLNHSSILLGTLPLVIDTGGVTGSSRAEARCLCYGRLLRPSADHMTCDRIMDTVPHSLGRLILVQSSANDPLLETLRLVIADTHRNPSPPRQGCRVIPHLHDTPVLDRIIILTLDKLLAGNQVLLHERVADRGHCVRHVLRIEENRLIITTRRSTTLSPHARQRLLIQDRAARILIGRIKLATDIESHDLVTNQLTRHRLY